MRILSITILSLLLALSSKAQSFPDDWIGMYKGEMILGNHIRSNDTIPVDFEIAEVEKDSVWTYRMTYHSEKFGEIVKDYLFVVSSIGDTVHYYLDEQNGIKMNLTYMNGSFYGMYDVLGNTYISTMRIHDDNLFFELIVSDQANVIESASMPDGDEESIDVVSPQVIIHQSVFLTKE